MISSKGRITIPADLRKRLGIKPDTYVNWSKEKGRLALTPMSERRRETS